jgi:hypothetical protein
MARQSEQLEREIEEARLNLAGALDELRFRLTPGNFVDQLAEYANRGPIAEGWRNLSRDVRDNPMPLLLIAMGVLWAIAWSNSRRAQPIDLAEPVTPEEFARVAVEDAVTSAPGQEHPVLVPAEG